MTIEQMRHRAYIVHMALPLAMRFLDRYEDNAEVALAMVQGRATTTYWRSTALCYDIPFVHYREVFALAVEILTDIAKEGWWEADTTDVWHYDERGNSFACQGPRCTYKRCDWRS